MGKRVLISGLGLMGGSLAMALKRLAPELELYGYDLPQVMDEALRRGIIQQKLPNWPDSAREMDIVFLATPLRILKQHLKELNGVVGKKTIVTDMGSTKTELEELVKKLGFSGTFIGGHPMTGAEKSGLQAANPLLYENAVYILTGVDDQNRTQVNRQLLPLLNQLKARVLLLNAKEHDAILAVISHLPQLLAIDLVNLVGQKQKDELPYFELAAGGFRDLTRIASSSYHIWQDIIASNRDNIRGVLKDFIEILQGNMEGLDDLSSDFSRANTLHARVPRAGKGFLTPLVDVMVYVTDEMGVIAKIANALAEHEIDIRDMELLKIREKEGGVFRLSFGNTHQAATAVRVLNEIGYQASIKE